MPLRLRHVLFAAVLPLTTLAGTPVAEVNVNVDLTKAGRKLTRPTPAHPVYYAAVVGGFHEEGAVPAGGPPPPPQNFVLHQMAVALASQGYLISTSRTPPPSLLLVFHWGSMNADIDEAGDPDNALQIFPNEKRMLALVAGTTIPALDPFTERPQMIRDMQTNRYFAMVSAYDFTAAQQHKKIALWRAKMSLISDGNELGEAIPALLSAGAPFLGKETKVPERVTKPLGHQGSVKLDETQFPDFPATPAQPPEKPKQP